MNLKIGKKYVEDIITFDTESTSLIKEKEGFMYAWMIGINEDVTIGRTYEELKDMIEEIEKSSKGRQVIIYVHNLSHDFQFLRNAFEFEDVFARKKREVIKCKIKNKNIYFKCSYALSNKSLNEIGEVYNKKYKKKIGDLDYSKYRDNKTKLTKEEIEYCKHDCLVLYEYIERIKKEFGGYKNIPLTCTGIVRREFTNYVSKNYHNKNKYSLKDWKAFVSEMAPTAKQFRDLVHVYAGGYVHSNASRTDKTIPNVKSIDFASSYPYVIVTEKYPMSRFWKDKNVRLDQIDDNKAYIMTLHFTNIRSTGYFNYISFDKIDKIKSRGYYTDNGRVDSADELIITCTEQDYIIISENYNWDDVKLIECKTAHKDYLPRVIIDFVLEKYKTKQMIKKQKNRDEVKYREAKEQLNSIYGMMITNYIRDECEYDICGWTDKKLNDEMVDNKLNEMKGKQLFAYSWGVWITAYARRNIWHGITHMGYDAIYSDTDSIKYTGEYNEFINTYNINCVYKLNHVLCHYGIKFEDWMYGLGFFENDGIYEEFKTLGAKKYCYRSNGKLGIRLSGVTRDAAKYLKNDIDNFTDGFVFKENETGKLGKYYNDNGSIDKYSVCLFPVSYIINTGEDYNEYIIKSYNKCEVIL